MFVYSFSNSLNTFDLSFPACLNIIKISKNWLVFSSLKLIWKVLSSKTIIYLFLKNRTG